MQELRDREAARQVAASLYLVLIIVYNVNGVNNGGFYKFALLDFGIIFEVNL